MDFLTDWLTNWLKELLIGGIMGNLEGLFDTVNTQVGEIAAQVGTTPAAWHAGVFSLIRQLSETVILPIAGMVLTFVATYELIQMLLEKNNMHEVDVATLYKWMFKTACAKINEPENRLQLIFEEKPDANQRQELKSNGFKWAPSQGAWQRQLNQNAIRAAARIDFLRPEDGTSPYQLQPFVKRENKEMSR